MVQRRILPMLPWRVKFAETVTSRNRTNKLAVIHHFWIIILGSILTNLELEDLGSRMSNAH